MGSETHGSGETEGKVTCETKVRKPDRTKGPSHGGAFGLRAGTGVTQRRGGKHEPKVDYRSANEYKKKKL